ncbi:hypothetical protein BgiMline_015008, partial [Biomphalaria glabrata]
YLVQDRHPSPGSVVHWSSLTVFNVNQSLSQVICQQGADLNVTNVTVAVKPRELECDAPIKSSAGDVYNITCRFLVLPRGKCTLSTTPPLVMHTINTEYWHRISWVHNLYSTTCTIQAVLDLSTYHNVSMFQVIAEPDLDQFVQRPNLSVTSHLLSLESTDKVMTFTANSQSMDLKVAMGAELSFVCYISNAPGVLLRLFKGSTVIALHTPLHSDRLHFVIESTDCDDTATYTCRSDHVVRLEQKLNVTIRPCSTDNEDSSLPYVIVSSVAVPILTIIILVHVVFCVRYIKRKHRQRRNTESHDAANLDSVVMTGALTESMARGDGSQLNTPNHSRHNSPLISRRTPPAQSTRVTPVHSPRSTPLHSPHNSPASSRRNTPVHSRHVSPFHSHHATPVHSNRSSPTPHPLTGDDYDDIDDGYDNISFVADPPNYSMLFQNQHGAPDATTASDMLEQLPLPPSYSSVMLNNLANLSTTNTSTRPKQSSVNNQNIIDTRF